MQILETLHFWKLQWSHLLLLRIRVPETDIRNILIIKSEVHHVESEFIVEKQYLVSLS